MRNANSPTATQAPSVSGRIWQARISRVALKGLLMACRWHTMLAFLTVIPTLDPPTSAG